MNTHVVTSSLYPLIIILALPLAQFGITPVNLTNWIRTQVDPDLIPVSYITRIHRRMFQNLVAIYILIISNI